MSADIEDTDWYNVLLALKQQIHNGHIDISRVITSEMLEAYRNDTSEIALKIKADAMKTEEKNMELEMIRLNAAFGGDNEI